MTCGIEIRGSGLCISTLCISALGAFEFVSFGASEALAAVGIGGAIGGIDAETRGTGGEKSFGASGAFISGIFGATGIEGMTEIGGGVGVT